MDSLNLVGSFDGVWICHLKFHKCLLIVFFANTWNVLIYYTCPFSIKQLLCILSHALTDDIWCCFSYLFLHVI
jgi:hypothetical protein